MKAKREAQAVAKGRGAGPQRGRKGSVGSAAAARTAKRATADAASSRRTATRPGKNAAPTRESRTPRSGPQTSPVTRPVERTARPKSTSQAKARAKARKAKAPKVIRPKLTERLAMRLASIDLRPRTLLSKVPFVVLVIGALGVGLGLTLWLSTDSAERSYHLSDARERTRLLQEQKEALERDVREAQSAPALAEAARKQGMIPTRDTAHLVQDPGGNWVVVGTPKPADGVPPPPLNAPLPEPGPPPSAAPPVVPPEVPIMVQPGLGDPHAPLRSGPEALTRAPDGSSTVGGQHLPQAGPQLPAAPPGPIVAPAPGMTPIPGLPAPGAGRMPAQGPAEVPAPTGALPVPALPGSPVLPVLPVVPGAPVFAPVPPSLIPPALAPPVTGPGMAPGATR